MEGNTTVISTEDDNLSLARDVLESACLLALDCEGIDLTREGTLCIVQLSTDQQCFLFDVMGIDINSEIALFLKEILEKDTIVKIIHDCKIDSDVLYHQLGITLAGVHDTQACHEILRKCADRNLNDTLLENGLRTNIVRDKKVYESNLAFWATRPMTPKMIQWASCDVLSLFNLYRVQIDKASDTQLSLFKEVSRKNASKLRRCIVEKMTIKCEMGLFIGRNGSNMKALGRDNPDSAVQMIGKRSSGQLLVYAPDSAKMEKMKGDIRRREKLSKRSYNIRDY
jgi:exonuclease 3'-5' domain-containing protein 1